MCSVMNVYSFPSLFYLDSLRRVCLAVRQKDVGWKPLFVCLWLPSPTMPQEVGWQQKPPAFPNVDG